LDVFDVDTVFAVCFIFLCVVVEDLMRAMSVLSGF
jgi:hypothetical protein